MTPAKPQGLIDRVIQNRYCPDGTIGSLNPKAFRPKKDEHELSFSDRNQIQPSVALAAYNQNPDASEAIQGKWTAAVLVAEAESIVCVEDVILDNPETDPAHVAVLLNPQRTEDEEDRMCTKMVDIAQKRGLFT